MNGGWYSVKDVNWKNIRGSVSDQSLFRKDLAKLAELGSDKKDGKVSVGEAKSIIKDIEIASKVGQVDGHLRPTEALKGINELLLTATGEKKAQLQKAKSSLLAELGSAMNKYDLENVRSAAGDLSQADFEKRFDQVIPLEKAITNVRVSQKPLDLMIGRKGGEVTVFYRDHGSTQEWKVLQNGVSVQKEGFDVDVRIQGNITYAPDAQTRGNSTAGELLIAASCEPIVIDDANDIYSDKPDETTWNIHYVGTKISAKNFVVEQHMDAAQKIKDEDCIYYKKQHEGTVGALLNGKIDVNNDGFIDEVYLYEGENKYLQVEYNYKGKPNELRGEAIRLFQDADVDLSSISDAKERLTLKNVCMPKYSKYDFTAERHWVHVLKQQDIDDSSYTTRIVGDAADARAIEAQATHTLGMDDCFKHLQEVVKKRGSPLKELTLSTHGVDDREQEEIVKKFIDDGVIEKGSKLIFNSCSNAEGCQKFETCKMMAQKYAIELYASKVTEYVGDSVLNSERIYVSKLEDYDPDKKYFGGNHFPKYIDLWYFSPSGFTMQMNYPHGYIKPKK